ncbi:SDR family oxidoreductase [Geoalkalibacter sp.]|uniref:SDR family oxidoreductase n=1 Tax=Geoalkalibacter sp. TaxID=3041440 RepID=UPI00272E5E8F|nr:SDR family oxidoreductase [Geoalkalibacter sp.]
MDKTLLITGANRGIGLELARQYLAANWRVLACCRNPDQATELQALAQRGTGKLAIHALDVARDEDIARLARELREEKIDILFQNAGIGGPRGQGFAPIDSEEWLKAFRVNVLAPFHLTLALVDQVAASQRRIVAIMGTQLGSITDNTSGGRYVYRSTKAAVHMVGKSLSIDLAPRGITTLLLHPGWVRTAMGGAQATMSVEDSVRGLRQVLERATPADSGQLIAYDGRILPW